ncbi:MAG: response regulator [Bacteroidia bacterium]|nr:response regulator [Bacteroidia bacterium]
MKIHLRFWQVNSSASRKFGGTGLGLAISKGLIELMGGTIALESELNKGTRFTFTIPYLTGLISTTDKQISISPEKYDWGGKVLLLAEDDKVSIKYFENILKPTNIQLIISENGLDAINICNQKKVDIVLMDVQLPEIDGYTAVRQIKTAHPDIIIIAETANAMQEDREKCLAAGFDDYIAKPIRKKDLLEIIGKYFA